jgi:hypothetical protein
MPKSRSRSNSRRRRSSRVKGGDAGTSAWGTSVFGAGDNQHAVHNDYSNANNLIHMNSNVPVQSCTTGGSNKAKKGGNVLSNVAVPAVLLYANNLLKPGFMGKTKKYFNKRGSRRVRTSKFRAKLNAKRRKNL